MDKRTKIDADNINRAINILAQAKPAITKEVYSEEAEENQAIESKMWDSAEKKGKVKSQ